MKLQVKLLNGTAMMPTRAHEYDAGFDLYASEHYSYRPSQILTVSTAIALNIPPGFVGVVRDRSSISLKGLKVTAGVVDSGYTGEIKIVMLNVLNQYGHISKGTKIAQILILPVALPSLEVVEEFGKTDRGEKGFGSSGL